MGPGESTSQEPRDVQSPPKGRGPLLERDYWAVVKDAHMGPLEVAAMVSRHFEDMSPPSLVRFRRESSAAERALKVGDELDVDIRMAGEFGVRVIHRCGNSITLATLKGHPEAGRITFGAYHNTRGDVVFHIRSRARAGSRTQLAAFLFAGDPMQTNTWCGFINRVAALAGDGVEGAIHVEKRSVEEESGDRSMDGPTYIAEGA